MWAGHTVIIGRTGSGKTYYTIHKMLPKKRQAVFFWNSGHEEYNLTNSIKVDGNDNISDIMAVLRTGKRVIYTPSVYQEVANEELKYWQRLFMQSSGIDGMVFVIDEAARYAPQGSIDTPLHLMATGGRRWGIECVFICQRVADLAKTVVTQCLTWIVFKHSPIDASYLKQRGINITDDENSKLEKRKHTFVIKNI